MFSFKAISVLALISQIGQSVAFQNPVRKGAADPAMVYADHFYYLTYTSGDHIEITKASTIQELQQGEVKVIWRDDNPTRNTDIWAPEMHFVSDTWYMFYSSRDKNVGGSFRTRVLRGCQGPNPFDCDYAFGADLVAPEGQRGGPDHNDAYSIDGSYLIIPGKGEYHLLSMHDEKGLQSIGIAQLNTKDWTVGKWSVICRPDQPWEKYSGEGAGAMKLLNTGAGLVEGPYALYHDDDIWISYSGSSCDTPEYSLGLLHYNGGDPLDISSWEKTGPVLSSANGNYGTGHNSFFSSPDGKEIWNLFHATSKPSGSCSADRYTMAQLVTFDDQGNPNFEQAHALNAEIPDPSGQ